MYFQSNSTPLAPTHRGTRRVMTTSAVAQPKQNYNKNKPDFTSPLVNKKKMFYVSNEL